ncbi:MAG TPA: TetR family transcriptional regulator C-terminal domain-containing protein [Cyclobacteriaceae bacterium]
MAVDEAVQDKDLKGCFVVNTITELIPDNSKILDRLEENQQSFENIIYDYLKKGQGSGQLSTDLDLKPLATLLFTIYNGIKVVSKVHPDKNELLASVNLALSLLE